jgi:hypothetical protein
MIQHLIKLIFLLWPNGFPAIWPWLARSDTVQADWLRSQVCIVHVLGAYYSRRSQKTEISQMMKQIFS